LNFVVFFAACPTQTPDQFWKKPMLPMALDALLDVMTTNIDEDRLEKEVLIPYFFREQT